MLQTSEKQQNRLLAREKLDCASSCKNIDPSLIQKIEVLKQSLV